MKWLAIALVLLAQACGSDDAPIAVVEVDTTELLPAPDTLFLTLDTTYGASIAHTSDVAASGRTRIEILANERTPAQTSLTVTAYAARTIVAQSQPAPLTFSSDTVTTLTVTLP